METSTDNEKSEQSQYKIISLFSIIMISIGLIGLLSSPENHFIFYTIFGAGTGTVFYGAIGLYNQYSD